MGDLELTIIKPGYISIFLKKGIDIMIKIIGIAVGLVILSALPSKWDMWTGDMWILEEFKWTIFALVVILIFLYLLPCINKKESLGKLIFKKDRIIEKWDDKVNVVHLKEVKSIRYLYSNIPKDMITVEKEKHWVTINFENKELYYEFVGEEIHDSLIELLEKFKKAGLKISIETVY